jgi:hypothetical protein
MPIPLVLVWTRTMYRATLNSELYISGHALANATVKRILATPSLPVSPPTLALTWPEIGRAGRIFTHIPPIPLSLLPRAFPFLLLLPSLSSLIRSPLLRALATALICVIKFCIVRVLFLHHETLKTIGLVAAEKSAQEHVPVLREA